MFARINVLSLTSLKMDRFGQILKSYCRTLTLLITGLNYTSILNLHFKYYPTLALLCKQVILKICTMLKRSIGISLTS